jgi:hypothetical protein
VLISILYTLLADVICAVFAIAHYRKFSRAYQLLAGYQILSALVEIAGMVLVKNKLPNLALFSVYGLVSFVLLAYFCYVSSNRKMMYLWATIPAIILWIMEVLDQGIQYFPSYYFLLQSVILVCSFFAVLYRSALTTKIRLRTNPDFFTGLAILVFYGCMTHYLIFELNGHRFGLTTKDMAFLSKVTPIYSNLKAVMILIAFILERKKATPAKERRNE